MTDQEPEQETFAKRFGQTLLDWGIALGLTYLGFWMISAWRTPDLPEQAPLWDLPALTGEQISLDDYKGQEVILNFWATWCGPCRAEIPEFRTFVESHSDIPVLGIAMDGTKSELTAFSKKYQMNYPVLMGDSSIQKEYKVDVLPMTVLIGADGKVKDIHVGAMSASDLNNMVD